VIDLFFFRIVGIGTGGNKNQKPGLTPRSPCDPDSATEFVSMTTGTRVERVPRLAINRLSALGEHANGRRVLARDLPAAAADGLLGVDFFRNVLLTIDFRAGQITVT
jgi:hypothetical protein